MPDLITSSVQINTHWLQENILNYSDDVKQFTLHYSVRKSHLTGVFLYRQGQTDLERIEKNFLTLLEDCLTSPPLPSSMEELVQQLKQPDVLAKKSWSETIPLLFQGQAVILIDTFEGALVVDEIISTGRMPDEPPIETSVRGPRDGFVEELTTNLSLVRKRLPTEQLACEFYTIGKRSKTQIAFMYLRGTAKPELVNAIRDRLKQIDIEFLAGPAHLEEYMEDKGFSFFPKLDFTERPQRAVYALNEGRIALLIDGNPVAILAPVTLWQQLVSVDDYLDRYPISFLTRPLRVIGIAIALFLPALYVASTEYHQDTIPIFLLISLVNAHKGVPFPTPLETLVMLLMFELFREAGLRLPRVAGQTIGILGTVVVGDAAVRAGIAGTVVIVVIGVTAVATFAVPNYSLAGSISIIRVLILVMASFFGYIGMVISVIFIIGHLANLQPFGVPYLAPFSPFIKRDWTDAIIRAKWTKMNHPKKHLSSEYTKPKRG